MSFGAKKFLYAVLCFGGIVSVIKPLTMKKCPECGKDLNEPREFLS